MAIEFINTKTGNKLTAKGDELVDCITGDLVSKILHNVPRFVAISENYAEDFAWQWKNGDIQKLMPVAQESI